MVAAIRYSCKPPYNQPLEIRRTAVVKSGSPSLPSINSITLPLERNLLDLGLVTKEAVAFETTILMADEQDLVWNQGDKVT